MTITLDPRANAVLAGVDDLGAEHAGPAYLLLPGWCGDRNVFDGLAMRLASRRRTVVSDLRGQGGRASESDDFTSADQVEDLLLLLDTLEIERVVPVTLAHAGWLAVEVRRRLGADRVPGVVLADWMPLGTPPGFSDALVGLQDEDTWQGVRAALFGLWTQGVDTPEVHEYVASMGRYGFAHWRRAGREIASDFARYGTPLAAFAEFGNCPVLHLYAQPADPAYLAAQVAAAQEHPWFQVSQLDAVSHFPMLEVPAEMAAAIADFTCSLA